MSDRHFIQNNVEIKLFGEFCAVSDIVQKTFSFLIFPIALAIHPIFTTQWNTEREKLLSLQKKLIVYLIILAIIFAGICFNIKTSFYYTVFNITKLDKLPLLMIIAGQFIWSFILILQKPLEANGDTVKLMFFILFSFLVYFLLQRFISPTFGILMYASSYFVSGLFYIIPIIYTISRYKA